MGLNKDLLLAVMEEIEKFPETHNQDAWFRSLDQPVPSKDGELCDTSFCFAGHAAILSGAASPVAGRSTWAGRPDRFRPDWWVDPATGEAVMLFDHDDYLAAKARGAVSVANYARRVLGLTLGQATALFHSFGGHAELREIVERYIRMADVESVGFDEDEEVVDF